MHLSTQTPLVTQITGFADKCVERTNRNKKTVIASICKTDNVKLMMS